MNIRRLDGALMVALILVVTIGIVDCANAEEISPHAYAPPVVSPSMPCTGGVTFGFSTILGGQDFEDAQTDQDCQDRDAIFKISPEARELKEECRDGEGYSQQCLEKYRRQLTEKMLADVEAHRERVRQLDQLGERVDEPGRDKRKYLFFLYVAVVILCGVAFFVWLTKGRK